MQVSNFWGGFDFHNEDRSNSPFSDFLFQGLEGSDVHVGSVFGHSSKPYDLVFSGENTRKFRHDGAHFVFKDQLKGKTGKADWFIGVPESPHPRALHLPLYFCYWAGYRHLHGPKSPSPPAKQFGLTVTIGNFKNGGLTARRAALAHQLSHFIPIHANRAVQRDAPKDSKVIYHDVPDKMDFISRFSHHLCFENSSTTGYLTEKIFDPIYVGSVPVYAGDPMASKWIHKDAFIDCLHLEPAEILDRIQASDVLTQLVSEQREVLSLISFEEMSDRIASFNSRVVSSIASGPRRHHGPFFRALAFLRRTFR